MINFDLIHLVPFDTGVPFNTFNDVGMDSIGDLGQDVY